MTTRSWLTMCGRCCSACRSIRCRRSAATSVSDLAIDDVVHNCASRIAPVSLCSEVFDAFGHPADGAQRWQSVCSTQHYSSSRNFLAGEYAKPVRVVAFNGAEGWCRDG